MPIVRQTEVAKGADIMPTSMEAGDVIAKRVTYTFPENAAAGDIVEMLILPAGARIVDLTYFETGAPTEGSVGIMAGTPGDTTLANRAVGTNLITTGKANAAAIDLAASNVDRSIGVAITAANVGASITLMVLYAQ